MGLWRGLLVFAVALMCFAQFDPQVRGWEGARAREAWDQFALLFGRQDRPAGAAAVEAVATVPAIRERTCSPVLAAPAAAEPEGDAAAEEKASAWLGPGYYSVEGIAPGPAIIYALEQRTLDAAGGKVLGGPFQSDASAQACAQKVLGEREQD